MKEKLIIITGTPANRPLYWAFTSEVPGYKVVGASSQEFIDWMRSGKLVPYFSKIAERWDISLVILRGIVDDGIGLVNLARAMQLVAEDCSQQSVCLTDSTSSLDLRGITQAWTN